MEGEYDSGSKYDTGSEYDPGFILENKLYEEDGEIEMPPEYVGKAGTNMRSRNRDVLRLRRTGRRRRWRQRKSDVLRVCWTGGRR